MQYNCPTRNIVDVLDPSSKNHDGIHTYSVYNGQNSSITSINQYKKYAITLGSSVAAGSGIAKTLNLQSCLASKFDHPFINLAYGGSTISGDQQYFSKLYSSFLRLKPEFIYWHAGFNELFYLFQENEYSRLFGPSRQRFVIENKPEGMNDFGIISQLDLNVRTGLKNYTEGLARQIAENFPINLDEVYEKISNTRDPQIIVDRVMPIVNNIDFFEASIRDNVLKTSSHAKIKSVIYDISETISNSMRVVGHLAHSLDTNLIFQFQNIFQPSSFLNADDSSIDSICKSMLGIYKPWMLKQFDPANSLRCLLLRLTRLQLISVYYPLLQKYVQSSQSNNITMYSSNLIDRSVKISWRDEVHPNIDSQNELASYIFYIIKSDNGHACE